MLTQVEYPGKLGFQRRAGSINTWLFSALLVLQFVTASLAWGATNEIKDIKTSSSGGEVTITVTTERRPDFSVIPLSSPARLVIDIADAVPGRFTAPIPVNRGSVKEIGIRESRDEEGVITRVTIGLDAVVDYSSQVVGETSLVVTIKPKDAGTPAVKDDVDDSDLLGAELARIEQKPTGVQGKAGGEQVEEVTVTGGTTSGVRSNVPTSDAKSPSLAAGSSTIPDLIGLDFLPYAQVSRVRLTGSQTLVYKVSNVTKDNQVIVELPGAIISRKILLRPIDTSQFPSAVKMITAYPARGSERLVKVVIKLREKVSPKVEQQDSRLFIDFGVPASVVSKVPESSSSDMLAQESVVSSEKVIAASEPAARGAMDALDAATGISGVSFEDGNNSQFSGRRISIDVREADLHNVFRMISNVSKLNIVAADNVTGKVTVRLQNVPWDQALAVVLQSKSLGSIRFGNIVRIAPLSQLKDEQEARLSARKASQNLETLQLLVLPLNYAIAADVKTQVEGALSDRGKLTLDSRTNALILEDTASGLAKARELAASLDTSTPQVLIEARIVEVSSSFVRDFGIQWGGDLNASGNTGNSTGLFFPSNILMSGGIDGNKSGSMISAKTGVTSPNWVVDLPASGVKGALALNLGSVTDAINIDARLAAIESTGKGKVVSSPRISTIDNREATISQGTKIPYETVSASGTSVQFIEATLKLSVTPHITSDNRVFLKVKVSNNRPEFGQQVNGNPAIEVKEAQTEVMVKDGDTTIIGGVYTLEENQSTTGIPFFNKIPVLGWLFKNQQMRSSRKELLVFITPHVVLTSKKAVASGRGL